MPEETTTQAKPPQEDPKTIRDAVTFLYSYQADMQQAYKKGEMARYFDLACSIAKFVERCGLVIDQEMPKGYWIVDYPGMGFFVYEEGSQTYLDLSPYAATALAARNAAWSHARKYPHYQDKPVLLPEPQPLAAETTKPAQMGPREEAHLRHIYRTLFEKRLHLNQFAKIADAVAIVRTYAHYAGDAALKQSLSLLLSELFVAEEARKAEVKVPER